ncbi:MAG: GntR family transcriptional regulator [Candidatus Dormibacteria bacterium]
MSDAIREMIVSGQLPPGSPLRQRDLAELLGVSSTPVREAIRKLESEGLVESSTHRGATVAAADVRYLEESLRILSVLEGLAGRLAVERMADRDLKEIERLQAALVGCRNDERQRKEINRKFHFRVYECARSPMLLSIMRLLWLAFPGGPQVGRPLDDSIHGHQRLLDALRVRDQVAVTQAIEEHVLGMISYVRQQSPSIGAL